MTENQCLFLLTTLLHQVPSRLKEVLRTARERYDSRLLDNQRKVAQVRRMTKAHDSLMSAEKKNERKKKIRKEISLQEKSTPESYPTAKLKKQSSISVSNPAPSKSPSSTTKSSTQNQKKSTTGKIKNNVSALHPKYIYNVTSDH